MAKKMAESLSPFSFFDYIIILRFSLSLKPETNGTANKENMNVDDVPRNVAENPIDVDFDEDSQVEEAGNAEKPRRSRAWDHFEKQ
ncbi:hypothetical protein A2U01_0017432, partial [Trifolium medium]|nr:hypothetical protein [Trifolium medium]